MAWVPPSMLSKGMFLSGSLKFCKFNNKSIKQSIILLNNSSKYYFLQKFILEEETIFGCCIKNTILPRDRALRSCVMTLQSLQNSQSRAGLYHRAIDADLWTTCAASTGWMHQGKRKEDGGRGMEQGGKPQAEWGRGAKKGWKRWRERKVLQSSCVYMILARSFQHKHPH